MTVDCVDVLIEESRWSEVDLPALSKVACAAVLMYFNLPVSGFEICVMGCNDTRIAELNQDFRGKGNPTNVLSWPTMDRSNSGGRPRIPSANPHEMPLELGDIAISFEICASEAAQAGKTMPDHVTHLIVHAALHLLGYDHINAQDAALMEQIEVEILGNLGISDPYKA